MELTLQDIVDGVQGLLQDDQFDESLIRLAANWWVYEMFNDTKTRLMETSDTVTAQAGDTTASYPSDLMHIIGVYVTAPRVFQLSDPMEYKSFMNNYANFATATRREVSVWTPYGNEMRFSAPVNADTSFQIDYLREPEPMVNMSDVCEVPYRYSELVMKGTLARCMEINEDYEEAAQERDNYASQYTTFKRNEGRGGGKIGPASVMRTNRGRGRSSNPFEDGLRG